MKNGLGKLNRNVGIVEAVIDNGQRIVLRSLRGGKRICSNKGFEVGELLCYTINLNTGTIVELIPKKVADTLVFLGENVEIQRLLEEEPNGNFDGKGAFDSSKRPEDKSLVDCGGGGGGTTHTIGEDIGTHATPNLDSDWYGDIHYVEEEDGDSDNIPIPLPFEFAGS